MLSVIILSGVILNVITLSATQVGLSCNLLCKH